MNDQLREAWESLGVALDAMDLREEYDGQRTREALALLWDALGGEPTSHPAAHIDDDAIRWLRNRPLGRAVHPEIAYRCGEVECVWSVSRNGRRFGARQSCDESLFADHREYVYLDLLASLCDDRGPQTGDDHGSARGLGEASMGFRRAVATPRHYIGPRVTGHGGTACGLVVDIMTRVTTAPGAPHVTCERCLEWLDGRHLREWTHRGTL